MKKNACIYIAGHRGLVGSALVQTLQSAGYTNLITRTKEELDLRNQAAVESFFATERPEYVFFSAAKVGGIQANNIYPATFISDNLQIQTNVIQTAYTYGVKKFLFLGSSCIYPRDCPQPIKEEYLLTGPLEPTNEWYAIAKIAGIKLCQAYRKQYGFDAISIMPTNLYGPRDNFHLTESHVLPALLRRFHEAMVNNLPYVTIWGTGTPRREFLYVEDVASACLLLMEKYSELEPINVGYGEDCTIYSLSKTIADVVGFKGEIVTDPSKPDGTPQKWLDISKIKSLGWKPTISLYEGIKKTYNWYLQHIINNNI
ncbi:GDP-L-fucose synthase [Lawsonia intracellularis]|uniref:GDP-L-fucose synthase n=1 Tax=Lawsonia intracellularis (strain PHE/MN1-00) TaxID=363253 RepID=Q1MNQ1_LAWIP|nr:GDP-L-fucose synthase [Lawsonia intracellularis]AGC50745.1 NAD-dependent epimerase/dehydratase [Lawsonia intracellularis N343]KAA0204181.1 GDP-L-fucose synthase [Lawsonia intracellularis]MBZ3893310.1 GDP-L-fucose synthase [Lawsonia intracellularis]OMQ01708.1 GDP-fucose synthetase [Lawsonia intracellularis]RBN31962.1 GDP-L-fucose synthase [Lawsonia intracellularis]